MRQQNQRCQLHLCNYGSVLLSFRDMTTVRTTDDRRTETASIAYLALRVCQQITVAAAVLVRYNSRRCSSNSSTKGRYTLATKSKGRSTFGRQKVLTFHKVDQVEHVKLWRQCRPRQIGDKVESRPYRLSTLSPVCTGPKGSQKLTDRKMQGCKMTDHEISRTYTRTLKRRSKDRTSCRRCHC